MALLLPIAEVGGSKGHVVFVLLGSSFPNGYQPIDMLKWKGMKQQSVHGGENGSVGADAERQGHYRHQRDAGTLGQHAQAEFQVLNQGGHAEPRIRPSGQAIGSSKAENRNSKLETRKSAATS